MSRCRESSMAPGARAAAGSCQLLLCGALPFAAPQTIPASATDNKENHIQTLDKTQKPFAG